MRATTSILQLGLVLVACTPSGPVPPEPLRPEPGMQLFPSARAFDGPGQVMSVNADGVWEPVLDLSDGISIGAPQAEAIPVLTRNTRSNAALMIDFAFAGASLNASRSRRIDYSIATFGTRRDRIQGADLRALVQQNLSRLWPEFEDGKQYFIVQETIWADSVSIILSSAAVDSLGGKATIQAAINNTEAGLSYRDSIDVRLVKRFGTPLRVFYKPYWLVPPPGGFGGEVADSLVLREVTDEIVVTQVRDARR